MVANKNKYNFTNPHWVFCPINDCKNNSDYKNRAYFFFPPGNLVPYSSL